MDRIVVICSEVVFEVSPISFVIHDRIRSTADIFWMRLEECYLFLEFFSMPDIIVILYCYIVSLSLFQEDIESSVWTEIDIAFYELYLVVFWEIL